MKLGRQDSSWFVICGDDMGEHRVHQGQMLSKQWTVRAAAFSFTSQNCKIYLSKVHSNGYKLFDNDTEYCKSSQQSL